MKAIVTYFSGVVSELAQVSWPKAETVLRLTLIVLIVTAVVGIYIGGIDLGFTKLLSLIIK